MRVSRVVGRSKFRLFVVVGWFIRANFKRGQEIERGFVRRNGSSTVVAILSPHALRTHHLHTYPIPHARPPFLIRNQNSLYTTHRTTYHITHHSSRVSYESSHDDNPIIYPTVEAHIFDVGPKKKKFVGDGVV